MISFNFLPFQVVQSLRLQSSSKNYSELGSCPTLNSSGTGPQQSNASAISSTSSSRPLLNRTLVDDASRPTEEFVQTATGRILVARQGDPSRPAIITYHDLGLNYLANFQVIALHGIISSWKYDCDEPSTYVIEDIPIFNGVLAPAHAKQLSAVLWWLWA